MVPIYHLSPPLSNPFPPRWSHAPDLRKRHPAAARLHRRQHPPPAVIWDARIAPYRPQAAAYRENGFVAVPDFLDQDELTTWRRVTAQAVSDRLKSAEALTNQKKDEDPSYYPRVFIQEF